jgi:hypothetical protein
MSTVTAVPIPPVKSSIKIWLWVGLLLAVAGAFGLAWIGTQHITEAQFLASNKYAKGVKTTASGLQYEVLEPGSGPLASDGDGAALTVHGTLINGKEFQPSSPLRLMVGQQTIPGFTEGVKLMRKGSKYRFWVPPSLGYGAPGAPATPLSTKVLVFEVEMTELVPAQLLQQMQQMQQQQQGAGGAGGPGGPGAGAAPEGPPQGQPEQ